MRNVEDGVGMHVMAGASGGTETKRKRKERRRERGGGRARALIVVETGSRAKTRGTCESARTYRGITTTRV